MSAIHHIDHDAKVILTSWEGIANDNGIIDALDNYQKNIQNHPEYIDYNEIIDTTHASSIKLTPKGINTLGTLASKTDPNQPNKKLAIIVNSNLAFGLARMYVTYRSFSLKASKDIRIFKNEKDALDWVKNKTK